MFLTLSYAGYEIGYPTSVFLCEGATEYFCKDICELLARTSVLLLKINENKKSFENARENCIMNKLYF